MIDPLGNKMNESVDTDNPLAMQAMLVEADHVYE